jgi:PTH2 family peptidyl-tRNA hydrolase
MNERQSDPIQMYIVVRKDLNLSIGKTSAQVGHAVGMIYEHAQKLKELCFEDDITIFQDWKDVGHPKIILASSDKDWEKLKSNLEDFYLVTDNGHTEVAPGTETVIGLFPMYKSKAPNIIKNLQTLKDKEV